MLIGVGLSAIGFLAAALFNVGWVGWLLCIGGLGFMVDPLFLDHIWLIGAAVFVVAATPVLLSREPRRRRPEEIDPALMPAIVPSPVPEK